jgi:hypothetical protein
MLYWGMSDRGQLPVLVPFVFSHLDGTEREDAEATRAEILKLTRESRQVRPFNSFGAASMFLVRMLETRVFSNFWPL